MSEPEFKNILPEDHYISQRIKLGESLTDAPSEFHFGFALSELSIATNRTVLIPISPSGVHPNFHTVILAPSTIYRKSPALRITKKILKHAAVRSVRLSQDYTPQALITALSKTPRGYLLRDEIGGFFANLKRDFMSSMVEILCELLDCEDFSKATKGDGKEEVKDPFLVIIGATVPAAFASYCARNSQLINSGFLQRIAWIFATDSDGRWMPRRPMTTEDESNVKELANRLKFLDKTLHTVESLNDNEPLEIPIEEEALKHFNDWSHTCEEWCKKQGEDSVTAFYGKGFDICLKIAFLIKLGSFETEAKLRKLVSSKFVEGTKLTVSEVIDTKLRITNFLTIDKNSMELAIWYFEKFFLPNALKVKDLLRGKAGEDLAMRIYKIALEHGTKTSRGIEIDHSKLLRYSNVENAGLFKKQVEILTGNGLFEPKVEFGKGPKPKMIYIIHEKSDNDEFKPPEFAKTPADFDFEKSLEDALNKAKRKKLEAKSLSQNKNSQKPEVWKAKGIQVLWGRAKTEPEPVGGLVSWDERRRRERAGK
jgi:hypothetical protein